MGIWSDDDDMTVQEPMTPRETTRELRKLAISVDKVTKYIFGNGEEGMDEVLRNLNTVVKNLQASFDDYKSERKKQEEAKEKQKMDDKIWIKRLVIATILPYALSFIIWFLYWFFKLQPLLQELEEQVK